MAYTANIVTVAEMNFMGGTGIDTTNGSVDANHIILQDLAEAELTNFLKFKLTAAAFAALNVDVKKIITEWAARFAGIELIRFNMLGEGGIGFTRLEAEDRINIHAWRMEKIERILNEDGVQGFMGVNI